jgi:hypothetical protein
LNSSDPAIPCTFSSGYSAPGRTEQTHGRFLVPSVNHWKDAAAILSSVEQHRPGGSAEFRPVGPRATFLYAVQAAIRNPAPQARMQFCHNGEHHELVTEKRPASVQLAGAILDQSGVRCSEFTIRLDPSDPSGIPTHIEFRAKSYLRLTFEAVPAGPETASLPWLLKEELV